MTRSLKLLVVDDDPDIRTIVEMALTLDGGIAVRTAASSAAAIAVLGAWNPDACLFDVMMPQTDGLSLMAEVRRLGVDTPIIFLTARAREADLERYRAAGALGTISKPFDPLTLADQVRRLLGG